MPQSRFAEPSPWVKKSFRDNGLLVMVSDLITQPTDELNGRRRVYRLVKEFRVALSFDGGYFEVQIPVNFKTDFATFPVWTQIVLGNRDAPGIQEASVIHDRMCELKIPATVSNAVMLAVLSVFNVPRWKRGLIFFGLSYFGYRSFLLKLAQRIKRWLKRYPNAII